MHASSLENMKKCYRQFVEGTPLEGRVPLKVLDIGGADVNGSYADVFHGQNIEYIGADLYPGEGVTVVMDDPNVLPLEDNSIDIVISGQMLEHCEFFWIVFAEMVRVLKDDGYIFLIAPSAGPIHKYPVDCYRFYPDAYRALAKLTHCHLLDVWHDNRGPWNDLVGIFNKTGNYPDRKKQPDIAASLAVNDKADIAPTPYEKVQGEINYKEVLRELHVKLQPNTYLEIGVRHGLSLALAKGVAVGVDPLPEVKVELPNTTRIIQQTSDDFFDDNADPILSTKPEFVFIDGMHLFENVLRDFMNVEKISGTNTVVVIDDVFPNEIQQASRERHTKVWTGDVWKILPILKKYRPDLCLIPLDTSPTGLLLITGLDASNTVLWQKYNPIVREALFNLQQPDEAILGRQDSISPTGKKYQAILNVIKTAKMKNTNIRKYYGEILTLLQKPPAEPVTEPNDIELSVVLISYNMTREVPRTLQTLSPKMQEGIRAGQYEIIVIDNGSTEPFDHKLCQSISPNIRIITREAGDISPVKAINQGISEARGDLIGVLIDGARMVSPGLLTTALEASRTNPCAVIGTLAFHLGNDVQMKSVQAGYNQEVEDKLLASVSWEEDGYKLFDISVFAGSSAKGWFETPAETNALFMRKAFWQELGGFEEKFQKAGGGLANLDMWHRAYTHPKSKVVMLLGEATFHQFHGGIATNASQSPWEEFHQEYVAIRGHSFSPPTGKVVTYYGSIRNNQKRSVLDSAYMASGTIPQNTG